MLGKVLLKLLLIKSKSYTVIFLTLPCNNLEVEILHKIAFILKNSRQQQVKYKRNILDCNLILGDSYLLQQPIPPPAREHHTVF